MLLKHLIQYFQLIITTNDIHDLVFVMVKCTFIDSAKKCVILAF